MTTAGSVITSARRMLLAGTREEINVLATTLSDTTGTSVVVSDDLRGIQEGAVLEVEDELMFVRSVDDPTKTATVIRAYEGSTAATHTAGVAIVVDPKFSRLGLLDMLNDALDDLSGEGLFTMNSLELTYTSSREGYNLTGLTDVEDVYAVYYQDTGSMKEWPRVPRDQWELRRDAETDDFASGLQLVVYGYAQPGRQLRVQYKSPFTRLTATSQSLEVDAGFPSEAIRLLKIAAAMQMVYWRETARNVFESQGDTRRAAEVPAGANIGAARAWEVRYEKALQNELDRLARRYPDPAYG